MVLTYGGNLAKLLEKLIYIFCKAEKLGVKDIYFRCCLIDEEARRFLYGKFCIAKVKFNFEKEIWL